MALRQTERLNFQRGNRLTSAPAAEPVTATELRTQLRTDSTDLPDAQANLYIAEARQELEDQTGLALISQSWQLTIDRWPSQREPWWDGVREGSINDLHGGGASSLELPRYPLQSITSCTVYDEDSNSTAVTVATTFDVDTQQMPGRLTLQRGATWPIALRANNAIEVVYVSGYGDASSDVPAPLKRAVRSMAAYLYQHRGDGCDAGDAYQASGAAATAGKYKVRKI